ncbi:MAG: TonB-dependent receptor [Pedobacter sp.]|nr:MAG: TonB-dependent receptor [Pedobacter sp.]
MNRTLTLILFLLMGFTNLYSQDITLKGTVSDEGGAMPGVSVKVSGSAKVTTTDANGNFQIPVKNGESVVISAVGYEAQTIKFAGQQNIRVILKSSTISLDETVVVGYAVQKKATLTGSVSAISGKELNTRSVASLSTALQGKLPGVTVQQSSGQPGDDGANIRIRGIGSINSTTFPLVLVDGIETGINQVDMNTVETISVLKDAASAAIYGSRASNGVILITTKRGKAGTITTNYNGYSTLQRPTNMPMVLSAYEYLQSELNSFDNAGITVPPSQRVALEQLIEDQRTLKPDNWNRYDTDWRKETMKDYAFMQNHNVSISGGSDKLSFFGSGSYLDQDGLIPNNNYKRTNILLNADAQLLPWAKFSLNTSLRTSNELTPGVNTPKNIISKSLYMLPTLSAARELDGNWGYGKNGDNPTAEAYASGENINKGSEAIVSGMLTLTPIKNFEVLGQYSLRTVTNRSRSLITPYVVSLKGAVKGTYPPQDGLTESWSQTVRNYYRLQTSYEKNIDKHALKFLIGYQGEDNNNSSFFGAKNNFTLGRYYLSNGEGKTATSGGGASSWAMMSGYGRINYNYGQKYLLEINGRYDGSSRFTESNRWGFFPSASAGWVISEENFMSKTKKTIDLLKLRVSYGILGNQDIGNYPYTATVNSGYGYYLGDTKTLVDGVAQVALSNSDITWERSKQFDVGVDLNMFASKLSVTADYYVKKIDNMLLRFPLPYYAGQQPAFTNAGDMENKGWEIAVGYKDKIRDFSYGITVSVNDNRNKITDLNGLNSQDKTQVVGYPNNGVWGYLSDGYYKDAADVASSPKLSNSARPGFVKYKKIFEGPGVDPLLIDSRDQVYLGDPFPHYEYGVNLTAGWKNFDFNAFIQGIGQRSAFLSGIGLKPFANGSNLFRHQLDSWTPENPDAEFPILVPEANSADNFVRSDKWVRNAFYGRLKNVVLGYTLPKKLTQKMKLQNIRLYVSGQNLFTISKFYEGYDPEVSYGGSLGGEFYPIMQTYTFGLNVSF